MVEVYPDLAGVPITHSWTGQLGITFDHASRWADEWHPLCRWFWRAWGRRGNLFRYRDGADLAGKKQRTPFAEIPQQTMFFYRHNPWFLPFAAWYYRFSWIIQD